MALDEDNLARVFDAARSGRRLAVVTGAGGSIGGATIRRLQADGYAVIAADIATAGIHRVLDGNTERVAAVELNVTDGAGWKALARQVDDGIGRLDVLVNNAGTLQNPPALIEDLDEEEFRRVIEVNLVGTFLGIKHFVPLLRKGTSPSIVNVSSSAAITATPMLAAYTSSKSGVRGLSKAAAVELAAAGIRSNSVHPWGIDSPMAKGEEGSSTQSQIIALTPLKRNGTPDEAAELIAFLAGESSTFSTGSEFIIDGGHTAWSGY